MHTRGGGGVPFPGVLPAALGEREERPQVIDSPARAHAALSGYNAMTRRYNREERQREENHDTGAVYRPAPSLTGYTCRNARTANVASAGYKYRVFRIFRLFLTAVCVWGAKVKWKKLVWNVCGCSAYRRNIGFITGIYCRDVVLSKSSRIKFSTAYWECQTREEEIDT